MACVDVRNGSWIVRNLRRDVCEVLHRHRIEAMGLACLPDVKNVNAVCPKGAHRLLEAADVATLDPANLLHRSCKFDSESPDPLASTVPDRIGIAEAPDKGQCS